MIKVITLSTFIFNSFFGHTQNTIIPDPNFEQALIDLGYDSDLDGNIITANIDTVTNLNIMYRSISDLTGIEDFAALTSLICTHNLLASLDLSQNTSLTILSCSYNQLILLNIYQNADLTHLHCGNNQLTNLDVSQNTALIVLNCPSNPLISLNISQCVNLMNLICYDDQLTFLDITQSPSLMWLNCGGNQLTSLDVTMNTGLTELVCHNNQLTSLDVFQNTNLTNLDCDFNELTSLDVTQNLSLNLLYCFNNQLTSLDLSQNVTLERLACYDNQLSCLNVKNGNNSQMTYFGAYNNPNLTCIEVDDITLFTASWSVGSGYIDTQMNYSNYCGNMCTTSVEELSKGPKQLVKIVDLMGRETTNKSNITLIYIYSDSTTERVFEINP